MPPFKITDLFSPCIQVMLNKNDLRDRLKKPHKHKLTIDLKYLPSEMKISNISALNVSNI